MKLVETEVFKTSDGRLFESEEKAKDHQEDLLGQALDDFLPNDDRGNVTRNDRFNLLTKQMKDPQLKRKIQKLYDIIMHGED